MIRYTRHGRLLRFMAFQLNCFAPLKESRRVNQPDSVSGGLDRQRAEDAVNALPDLPLVRHGHVPYIARIWQLRASVTAYDAAYLALAEGLPAVLLTCDGRLARAHGHHARIELLT